MQIDMHYYGVYAMARAAGLTREASVRIATASELVDDNAEEEHVEFGDGGRLDLMPTAHHTTDTENRNEEMQRKVWVPFHFIPGNRGRTVAERLVCRKDSAIARGGGGTRSQNGESRLWSSAHWDHGPRVRGHVLALRVLRRELSSQPGEYGGERAPFRRRGGCRGAKEPR